uniref:Gypsy retrotransposon integrase-like protein 1 n=3 Tax=Denticeps clupeoides TaxID=299321 RepID=A0AAY4CER3_9TELE
MTEPELRASQLAALCDRIARQENLFGSLSQEVRFLRQRIQEVTAAHRDHEAASVAQSPRPPAVPEPSLPLPERWNGTEGSGEVLLTALSLIFELQPSRYPSARSRIALLLTRLGGSAAEWAAARISSPSSASLSYAEFVEELKLTFCHPDGVEDVASQLYHLRQGTSSVSQFTARFRTLAAKTPLGDHALRMMYYEGLAPRIRGEMVSREMPATYEALIQLAMRIDRHLLALPKTADPTPTLHQTPRPPLSPLQPTVTPPDHKGEPMQLGRTTLTPEEKQRRFREGLCAYCASPSHIRLTCPLRPGRRDTQQISTARPSRPLPPHLMPPTSRLTLPAVLECHQRSISTTAFVDSGAAGNFIDHSFIRQHHIPLELLPNPLTITSVDGHPISAGPIIHRTVPLQLRLDSHVEKIQFLVTKIITSPLLLGFPWLSLHEPHLSWSSGMVLEWGAHCHHHCLLPQPSSSVSTNPEPSPPVLDNIPSCYHDLATVFSSAKAAQLPPHRPGDMAIDLLPGTTPPKGHLYSLSKAEQLAMERFVAEALQNGTIRPSTSPAAAGFFFVTKKDGGLRPCVDYRGLNKITIKNRTPLPLTNTALDALSGAKYFTKLDLRSAYNLIRIREGDEWKTAFITPTGHFESLVIPFGLCNAPAVFQQFINDTLQDMLGRWVYAYLDDVLIYSPTLESHIQHVRAVLKRLLAHRLYCKLEKCAFHQRSTTFLGFTISSQGVAMEPKKLEAVASWPLPTTLKQLQRFLGFANFYRRFIRGYSTVAAPLTALTKPSPGPFRLTPEAIQAFKSLCHHFTTAPILQHPDPTLPFVVEVDASEVGAGAVLSQRGPDRKLHPCCFFSRKFTPAQRRYGVGDRELLAVRWALEEWRHWLQGSDTPFLVWTDHQNLISIKTTKQLNPRQARWALFFEQFDFQLSYRPGSKNQKADALSRQHAPDSPSSDPEPVLPPHRILGPLRWSLETKVRAAQASDPGPDNTPPECMYVPNTCRPDVLHWGHSSVLSGHPGRQRTLSFIRRAFWWPSVRRDVQAYVDACDVCARAKTPNTPTAGPLRPLPIPHRPWTHLALDFITGLPEASGMTTILTIVDRFSKAVHLVALPGLPSSATTADLVLQHVVRLHGFPQDIVSDRGPQFVSAVWKAFCRLIGSTCSLSSGYHPQTNGQVERANQQLGRYLRCFASEHQRTWPGFLLWAELAHNLQISSATGHSPFEICHGYQPTIFTHQVPAGGVPSARQMIRGCRKAWKSARSALLIASRRMSTQHDRRHPRRLHFRVGQRVWLSTKDLRLRTESHKLSPRYIGPFRILSRINPLTYRLQLPPAIRVHPVFHVSKLKPFVRSSLHPPAPDPPPPRIVDGGPAYTVERIIASRRRGRGVQYLVHWTGYGPEERSWIPSRFILDPSLVAEYRQRTAATPGPSGVGPGGGGTVT